MPDFELLPELKPKCSLCGNRGFLLLEGCELTYMEQAVEDPEELKLWVCFIAKKGYLCPCQLPMGSVPGLPVEKALERLRAGSTKEALALLEAALVRPES